MFGTKPLTRFVIWCAAGICVLAMTTTAGCVAFHPMTIDEVPFRQRAQTQEQDLVSVTVAVPSSRETKKLFGVNLSRQNIQPVWLEIRNKDTVPYWFFPSHLDPAYYSPNEAAFKHRLPLGGETHQKLTRHFQAVSLDNYIPPGTTNSGFVYCNLDEGIKHVNVTLLGIKSFKTFTFIVPIPDMRVDFEKIEHEALYEAEEFDAIDETDLREALEALPNRTTNKRGTNQGDPLNLVLIGHGEEVLAALIQSGWDETEMLYARSALKTANSFLFGKKYRYAPISTLYVYGRGQDAAFQKARETIHKRNHLRLWLTPKTYQGKPVWIGQISRDIGVKFTVKEGFIMTHVIDPDVDNDRWYLIQNLLDIQRVAKLGLIRGEGAADPSAPRYNLGGDPYYTDGLRAVIMFSNEPVPYDEVESFDWDPPSKQEPYWTDWDNRDSILY